MNEYQTIELTTGETYQATILAKAIAFIIVRTIDNRYLLISRHSLKDVEKYRFKE